MNDLEKNFEIFHSENPRIYDLFKKYCAEVHKAGLTRYSSKAIFERIRWHIYITTKSGDEFKLNNNYTAYYARLWLKDFPQHAGFLETRRAGGKAVSTSYGSNRFNIERESVSA